MRIPQLHTIKATHFTSAYDDNGNMSKNELNGLSSVDYDWRNLPSQLVGNAITMQYAYDGDGNRIKKKKVGGTELHYVRGAGGETLAAYKDDALAFQNIVAGAEIIGTFDGTQRRYFLKDHLGSIRTTVDQNGNMDGYDDYYPFGLVMPGRSSNTGNLNDNYKFTGHEFDDEAGLNIYYMIARGYDPVLGRFLQVDPLANEFAGWSPYSYTFNNPLKFTDPTGMSPLGDYFDIQGNYLGSDNKDDGKIYIRNNDGDLKFGTGVLSGNDTFSEVSSNSGIGLLARIGFAEFRGSNSTEQQVGMDITLNRVVSDKFPNSLKKVITQNKQYSSLNDGDPNKSFFENPVSQIKLSGANKEAWTRSASNAIKVYQGEVRGISKGALLYYSPQSMKPLGSTPRWNFSLLNEVKVEGVRTSHLRAFKYK